VTLVVAPVAPPLYGFELGELLLPVAQDMWLDAAEFTDFTDGEIALTGDRR
jgi:hypothetical protein